MSVSRVFIDACQQRLIERGEPSSMAAVGRLIGESTRQSIYRYRLTPVEPTVRSLEKWCQAVRDAGLPDIVMTLKDGEWTAT